MDAHWIVVANAGHARFFSQANRAASFEEVDDLVNAGSRLRAVDTETDDLGQRAASTTRHGSGAPSSPSDYQPHQTPAEHQAELFARTVAARLAQGLQGRQFGQVVLVASPEFLGVLRKQISPQVQQAVRTEIGKDYTHLGVNELRDRIAEHDGKG